MLPSGDPTHGANIQKAEYNGVLDGIRASLATPGLAGWNTGANATRGEVAQILWNLLNLLTPSGVWVYADGSGDYPDHRGSRSRYRSQAPPSISGPGTFNLTKMLLVDFSFNLVGSGMEGPSSSTVRYAGWVVDVHSVSFSAQDIRFVCTATNKAVERHGRGRCDRRSASLLLRRRQQIPATSAGLDCISTDPPKRL